MSSTFGQHAAGYARARPVYPPELYAWIIERCERRDTAWDSATGNGQAAAGLARYVRRVYATDMSREQIAQATRSERVAYFVQRSEVTAFPDHCIDLIVVAQALHWFDYRRFWPEVRRIARGRAFFCAWGYDWPLTTGEVDDLLVRPFRQAVAPFWAPNNRILWDGYADADIASPLRRVQGGDFAIGVAWRPRELLDYLMTWSAYRRACDDPAAKAELDAVVARARAALDPGRLIPIRMPLKLAAGYVDDT